MSLAEAVLDFAKEMENRAADLAADEGAQYLYAFAAGLKAAVKAAGPSQAPRGEGPVLFDRQAQAMKEEEAAALAVARQQIKRRADQEEFEGSRMTEVVGGPVDGTFAPRSPQMPVGARCSLDGAVYELRQDMKLYYTPPA